MKFFPNSKVFWLGALFFAALLIVPTLSAQEKNGYRILVQKTTLERNDERNRSVFGDVVDRTLALKVNVRNISMKVKPAAVIEYTLIVKRWGYSPTRFEKYSGTQALASLKQQEAAEFVLGKARLGGYANYNNKRYQDDVEAWRVVIKEEGIEVASFQNGTSFDKAFERAVEPRGQ